MSAQDKLTKFTSLLLFPVAGWQVWITQIPNYHLQHLFGWVVLAFLAASFLLRLWTLAEAARLVLRVMPLFLILLLLQVMAAWQIGDEFPQGTTPSHALMGLAKLIAQWPFLLAIFLAVLVLVRQKGNARLLLNGALLLFAFVTLVWLLQLGYVYLLSPDGSPYAPHHPAMPDWMGKIVIFLRDILLPIASIFEAQWPIEPVYSFYHGGSYALTLPRLNAIFEEASMFASHVGVCFVPLAAGLLGLARQSRKKSHFVLAWTVFCLSCGMLATCRSTTGQLLLVPALGLWVFLHVHRVSLTRALACLFAAATLFAVVITLIPQGNTSLLKRIDGYALSDSPRAVITRASLHVVANHPLLGTGREAYLPILYAEDEYRRNRDHEELAAWTRLGLGEMSALLAFTARYGIPVFLAVNVLVSLLLLRLRRLAKETPEDKRLALASPAALAWYVMALVTLLGSYDPRNALLLLPLACFMSIAVSTSGKRNDKSACLVMHSLGGGGEKMALLLAGLLAKSGWQTRIACLAYIPELSANVPEGVTLAMPRSPGRMGRLAFVPCAARMAREASVTVGTLELQSVLFASFFASGHCIGWLHKDVGGYLQGKSMPYRILYRALCGFAFRRCVQVVCVSQGIVDSSKTLWPGLQERFELLYNPLDIADVLKGAEKPMPGNVEQFFARGRVVLGVGRLEPEKNFSLLMEAVDLLGKRGIDARLCIAGEGSERGLLEQKAESLGIKDRVLLAGFVNPWPLMRQAAVLAMSSRFEGLPIVLVEALALGLPIVSVDCPSGPRELLKNGQYGMLVHSSPEELANGLQIVLERETTPAERDRLRQRAMDFSLERLVPRWFELMENVAGSNERTPLSGYSWSDSNTV